MFLLSSDLLPSDIFVIIPPIIPVIKAIITLIIAKGNPIREYVINIESKPVCGVDIKKETVEPLEAPCL